MLRFMVCQPMSRNKFWNHFLFSFNQTNMADIELSEKNQLPIKNVDWCIFPYSQSLNCVEINFLTLDKVLVLAKIAPSITVCKQVSSGLSKNVKTQIMCLQFICIWYMYINRIWHEITHKRLICHKKTQTKPIKQTYGNLIALIKWNRNSSKLFQCQYNCIILLLGL